MLVSRFPPISSPLTWATTISPPLQGMLNHPDSEIQGFHGLSIMLFFGSNDPHLSKTVCTVQTWAALELGALGGQLRQGDPWCGALVLLCFPASLRQCCVSLQVFSSVLVPCIFLLEIPWKNAWKRYSSNRKKVLFQFKCQFAKRRNCHERSILNLKFIKITLALWFSPHSFTTLIPKTSQSPQAHRAKVNLREKSQAPWVQKVPYFVRIQTYPNCNICNFAPQLQELVEGCRSIWSVIAGVQSFLQRCIYRLA